MFSCGSGLSLLLSPAPHVRAQTPTNNPNKVDDDGDGLIEIWNLSQLNHVRYNLAGTSYKNSARASGDTRGCGSNATAAVAAGGVSGKCHGYELMADLVFSDTGASGYNEDWDPEVQKAKWTPIGDYTLINPRGSTSDIANRHVFTGLFDGNNRTIANLIYVNSSSDSEPLYAGLFGYASGTIKNLGLIGEHMSVSVYSPFPYLFSSSAGGLVGYARSGTLTSCYATGAVSSSSSRFDSYSGGLVGRTRYSVTITNCYTTGDVSSRSSSTTGNSSDSYSGGLVGYAFSNITIKNCYATGNVSASSSGSSRSRAGGLVGHTRYSVAITNCYTTGDVSSSSSRSSSSAGGLVGELVSRGTITNCYTTGDVTSTAPDVRYSGASGISRLRGGSCYYSGVVKNAARGSDDSATRRNIRNATAIQTVGQYKTETQLKTPVSNTGIYSDWSAVVWDFGSASQLPKLLSPAPSMSTGQGTLTRTGQTFTVRSFQEGTVWYVLRAEGYSSSVTRSQIKSGVGVVGANKGSVTGAIATISLSGLNSGTQYTLYAYTEPNRGEHSAISHRTFTTAGLPLTLVAKNGALAYNSQTYRATFSVGTLYYLLKIGAYSASVTAANVRAGTSGGTVSPKEIALTGLRAGTRYTLYTISEASNGAQSAVVSRTFTTAGFPAPTLIAKDGALSYNSQTYRATFSVGTLYYLLRLGSYDQSVDVSVIRSANRRLFSTNDLLLGDLLSDSEYTLYAFVERVGQPSVIAHATFTTLSSPVRPPVVPVAPNLTAKEGMLTHESQIYTASFSSGMLYYLVKTGPYDGSVNVASIKEANQSLPSAGDVILRGLSASRRYTLYAFVERGGQQSSVAHATFTTLSSPVRPPVVPVAPTLTVKEGTLTHESQIYTASFPSGTMYYLVRLGAYDRSVDVSVIRSANRDLSSIGDVLLSGLMSETQYTLYAFVEHKGKRSAIAHVSFTTLPLPTLPPADPILEKGEVTATTVRFTSTYAAAANDKLAWVVVEGEEASDPLPSADNILSAYEGGTLSGKVVKERGVQLKSGLLENDNGDVGDRIDGLEADTQYILYAVYDEDTTDSEPGIVEAHPFTTEKADGAVRSTFILREFAYPNPTSDLLRVPVREGVAKVYSSAGAQVGSFVVIGGTIDLSDLSAGTYIVRLSNTLRMRVVKVSE